MLVVLIVFVVADLCDVADVARINITVNITVDAGGLEPPVARARSAPSIPQSLPCGRFGWELPIRFYTDQEHRMEQRAVSGRNPPYPPL